MIRIVIIGSGNVAHHLLSAFAKSDTVEVIQVFARDRKNIENFSNHDQITNEFSKLAEADLYIIAVSDNAIAKVSSQLNFKNRLVVHTSGTSAIDDLNSNNRKGVFYPLQTFSKGKQVNFNSIPICIEAQKSQDYKLLETIAQSISNQIFKINSTQRKALHVSAVFVCNFVNHLYKMGNDICNENNIPFDILHPLITETAQKILSLSPAEAQTGPAIRNDTHTINAHLNFLTHPNQKEIYKLLTKSIIDHGKKL
jgi:predicted short-subunit dehydrogenase-like oxidoreductase (DUF2520 family)